MSIMDMNSRMAMAEKLSVQQLQQAIQSGSLPAYIGIPLIEQKNKEKSQMAAAQQGQQKPPSVASQILQQAEQQSQGIDQLPSNLPTEQDEEMGMAEGGIVAFADEGRVRDPDEMTAMERLREENPEAYRRVLAQSEAPNQQGATLESLLATDYSMNQQEGTGQSNRGPRVSSDRRALIDQYKISRSDARHNPPGSYESPKYEPSDGQDQVRESFTPNNASIDNRAPGIPMGETFGTYADKAARFLRGDESKVPSDLRAYSDRGMFSDMPTGGPDSRPPKDPDSLGSNAGPEYQPGEAPLAAAKNEGVTALPSAKLAPPGTPGAPRTAPTGTPSAAPRTAPQGGGAPSSNPSALPPTLAAAERSNSPAANQATSMIDKYVAMLEKGGEDVGRQKKEALYMALIQGGLAAAGGTSPNAFANIAAGMVPAVQGYQQALAGIRKDDRARIEKLINAGISKEKLAMELRKLGIEEKKVDAMVNYYNASASAKAGGGDDNKKNIVYNTATTSYNKTVSDIDKAIGRLQEDPLYKLGGTSPAQLALKKTTTDKIDALEQRKNNAYKQYRGYVTDRLGIDIPDFSDPSGGGSKGLPMPKTKGELKTGETYNTAKGLAKWDGNQFVSGR